MASFLSGTLAKALDDGFKAHALTGQLHRFVPAEGLTPSGYPVREAGNIWTCRGFIDSFNDRFKANTTQVDAVINIFAQSLEKGTIEPQKDDKVQFRGDWYQLLNVKTDPAKALWVCDAFKCKIPYDLTSDEDTDMAVVNNPRPSFSASRSTTQAITAATWTKVIFNDIRNNVLSGYSGVAGNFAAPVAGIYNFNAKVIATTDGDASRVTMKFYVNGVAKQEFYLFNDWQSFRLLVQGNTQLELAQGDEVDVRLYAEGDAITLEADTNEFNGSFVGTAA